ncbi:phosphatidylinositol 3,4,5-trisphosphate 5-phosphatase 2 [Pseudonaja textilis]|uniref:phosphatidylinositol 3,4,5-trisphosphate 5-phosphatase 2 n=1 Tax=Pseudonaja textilis TaxID=8673 RepID=UPI000EA9CC94|nr:phosphatidylinositol 3,4,5-trisphosphate 5-phosphatase 2 [Pseudonaja textilis]
MDATGQVLLLLLAMAAAQESLLNVCMDAKHQKTKPGKEDKLHEQFDAFFPVSFRFQKHVHTYRILPDEEEFLAVQTSQGVPVRRFKTLSELIALYLQPNQGLACTLLFPVEREKEKENAEERDYSDGEDEKPPLPPRSGSTSIPGGSSPSLLTTTPPAVQDRALESPTNGLSTISHEYLKGSYSLDLEAVKGGASNLPHLNKTLVTSCRRLHRLVYFQTAGQTGEGQELDSLVLKLSILKDFLSNIEKKALKALQDMSSTAQPGPAQPSFRKVKSIPVQTFEVKLDLTLGDLTKIGKSQKYTLSVDVEGGKLVVLKKQKDSQEDWNTFTHERSKSPTPFGLNNTSEVLWGRKPQGGGGPPLSPPIDTPPPPMSLQIAMQSLWNIKIAVLVKPEHENRISHVGTSSVKTGIANTLGNKGAVGVSFMFNGTSFGFVNCHLTSGNEKTARRNQNYLDILRLLALGDKQLSSFDISLRFTHLFWFGDLNYRLDMDIQEILNYINRKEFEPLLKVDQLNLEKEKHKIFLRFSEEEVTFPPTYRYERGSRDTYVWHKQKPTGVRTNVPSWCDRILWKSYPETHINSTSYGCTDDIMSSDHSPVFAAFEVGVTSQFVSKKGLSKSSDQAYIEFESIEAIVKTASRTKFFIEFYSTCLEEFKKSFENDSQSSDNINFLKVQWSSRQLPTLKPILSDIEYLQDQHILLTVKSMDGYESYGECVIALKSMIGSTAQQFLTYLSHRGEETGNIRGSMRVRVPAERMGTRERLYEWISVDKDESGAAKGKLPHPASRTNLEHSKSVGRKHSLGEGPTCPVGKILEDQEKPSVLTTSRPPAPHRGTSKEEASQGRSKQEGAMDPEAPPVKNSFNNPAYYVLEGVPHQLLLPELSLATSAKPPAPRNKVQITVPIQLESWRCPQPPAQRAEENAEEEEAGVLNLPPPDFPPPPLPKSVALEMAEGPLYTPVGGRGEDQAAGKPRATVVFSEPLKTKPPKLHPRPAPSLGAGYLLDAPTGPQVGPGLLDDRSCSVLQMAKTLSEVEYSSGGGLGREQAGRPPSHPLSKVRLDLAHRCLPPDYSRPGGFAARSIRESIEEAEESLTQEGQSAGCRRSESSVGEWLSAIGMERYEEGLIHNGWDDLEFLR